MKKLDKTTKNLIFLSMSITGLLMGLAFSALIGSIAYGIVLLSNYEPTDTSIMLIIAIALLLGSLCSYLIQRDRFSLFKKRNNFE